MAGQRLLADDDGLMGYAPPPRDPRLDGVAPWSGLPPYPGYAEVSPADPNYRPAEASEAWRVGNRRLLEEMTGDRPATFGSNTAVGLASPAIIGGAGAANLAGGHLLTSLNEAQRRAAPGLTTGEATWNATGWQRFPDGRWRFEIPDVSAQLTPHAQSGQVMRDAPLRDVLQHDDLYARYPRIADMPTSVNVPRATDPVFSTTNAQGYFRPNRNLPGGGQIVTPQGLLPADLMETVLHETQHGVQRAEGHAHGASTALVAPRENAQLARAAEQLRDEEFRRDIWVANRVAELRQDPMFAQMPTHQIRSYAVGDWMRSPETSSGRVRMRTARMQSTTDGLPTPYQNYAAELGEAEARAVGDRYNYGSERWHSPMQTIRGGPSRAALGEMGLWDARAPGDFIRTPSGLLETPP